ncbi:MAG: DUF4329 domain-containing protein [Maricaulaceae bacterium]
MTFATQEEAAVAALNAANPQSITANKEFGGFIYRTTSGRYGYTNPSPGTGDGFDPSSVTPPSGTAVVGDYHTHGDYSTVGADGTPQRISDPSQDQYNSDGFSQADLRGIRNDAAGDPGYRGYLGTPSGSFYEYDPGANTVRQIN